MNEDMGDPHSQQFCLKWNNFHNNIMSQFEALKEDEDFVDVTLSSHGQSLKAHKVVLSACSPYLKNLFKENPCKHPVIILENVTFSDLEALIAFIYTGQVYVAENELSTFLKAAESLQIRGLTDSPSAAFQLEEISREGVNVPQVLAVSQPASSVSKRRMPSQCISDEEMEFSYKAKSPHKRPTRRSSTHLPVDIDTTDSMPERDWPSESDSRVDITAKLANLVTSVTSGGVGGGEGREKNNPPQIEDFAMGESRKPHSLDPRPCPLCNRVYSNLSNLRQHMRLIHNPTLVTCKLCSKTFKTDLYLRRHLVSYHELNLSPVLGGFVSIEPVSSGSQGAWPGPGPVKPEPPGFKEMFNTNEAFQVPQ